MSGHSKWASIKHKKGVVDARRGKIFTKLIKELTVAARLGGGDAAGNPRLRTAISMAKAENMPKENIERAIKKGTGELPGVNYEEVCYEGYGPGGVAVAVDALTDNKNRTVADIRNIFSKNGGSLGETGCVSWIFLKKGSIVIEKEEVAEDKLMNIVIDSGGDDIRTEGNSFEVITEVEKFESVKDAIEKNNIKITFAEITMIPQSTIKLEGKQARQMIKLMEALEDHDDVQKTYANFDISEEILTTL